MTKGDATCSLSVRCVVATMYVVLLSQNDKLHGALKQRASTRAYPTRGQETKLGKDSDHDFYLKRKLSE